MVNKGQGLQRKRSTGGEESQRRLWKEEAWDWAPGGLGSRSRGLRARDKQEPWPQMWRKGVACSCTSCPPVGRTQATYFTRLCFPVLLCQQSYNSVIHTCRRYRKSCVITAAMESPGLGYFCHYVTCTTRRTLVSMLRDWGQEENLQGTFK